MESTIPLANEEIATKHGKVLGQSAFALLPQFIFQKEKSSRDIRHVPAERAQKITKGSDPGEFKLTWVLNLARWQEYCRLPGPGLRISRSKQEADLATRTQISKPSIEENANKNISPNQQEENTQTRR